MALVSAVATLFAALFICVGPGAGPAGPAPVPHAGSAATMTGETGTRQTQATRTLRTDQAARIARAQVEARYICPYDNGDCGFFPHLSPAVLTVPPPAAPLSAGGQQPHLEPPPQTGQVPRSGARARAPDLHVLQVLRT